MDGVSFECGTGLYHRILLNICWRKCVLLPMLRSWAVHIHRTRDERIVESPQRVPSFCPSQRYGSLDLGHHDRNGTLGTACFCSSGSCKGSENVTIRFTYILSFFFSCHTDYWEGDCGCNQNPSHPKSICCCALLYVNNFIKSHSTESLWDFSRRRQLDTNAELNYLPASWASTHFDLFSRIYNETEQKWMELMFTITSKNNFVNLFFLNSRNS